MEAVTKRFAFLEPNFFVLIKITKSNEQKARSDVGLIFSCRLCPKRISAGISSVSNLRRHIKSQHPSSLSKYDESWSKQKEEKAKNNKRQASAEANNTGTPPKAAKLLQPLLYGVPTQQAIDRHIIRFIVETNQAFSVVESKSFQELVLTGVPGKTVMCRKTLKKKMSEKLSIMTDNLCKEFEGALCICICADIWSAATRSFLGICAHWISTTNLERKKATIACRRIKGHHTYDVIAKLLVDVMSKYNIKEKTTDATTDCASNFGKSFRVYAGVLPLSDEIDDHNESSEDENVGNDDEEDDEDDEATEPVDLFQILENEGSDCRLPPHTKCAVHRLNLVAKSDSDDALTKQPYAKHSRSAMLKAKKLFNKQSRSTLAADHIREHCHGLLFVIPNDTRWNSMYDGIVRLRRNLKNSSDNLDALVILLGLRRFAPMDILFYKEYVQVYRHFANTLDILQGDQNVYAGTLLPLINGLIVRLEDESKKVTICSPLAQALISGIKERFQADLDDDKLYVASAIHPRFKCSWIQSPTKRAEVWELVRKELYRLKHGRDMPDDETSSQPGSLQLSVSSGNESRTTPTSPQRPVNADSESINTSQPEPPFTLDRLVPLSKESEDNEDKLLEVFKSQPTTNDLSCLDNFPLIRKLFILRNTAVPSSASAGK